ncbi:ubiquinone/menaquinone biosynthesis C-methylase UbiE [Haloferula luteola]|uniref:Ubiquinone/menaquinone biosynthesis C-methylase UbiE n=1 Tax=Haloferula luteola TaxID=595692 RepID=A0A840VAS0_9BACT|nr:class I SAM-dependent methyltransferase [Haloferula luteola]MBB5350001.1 ubiquinone/menaquinone biosynthesis C-methylase UbiE [Haloferula luteola]
MDRQRRSGEGGWRPKKKAAKKAPSKGWDPVAAWYDQLVGKGGSDYHQHVVLPATLEMLGDISGLRGLDLCCGQGVLVPELMKAGAREVLGVDASPRLIESAQRRFERDRAVRFVVADACAEPSPWADGHFDFAACLMAVHDVPDLPAMARNAAAALKPGGEMVVIFMHPCFRIPRQTHWGWDEGRRLQYRRVDRYGVDLEIPIKTHPGKGESSETLFYHRPLAEVLNAFGQAGLALFGCEELYSHRRSQAGGIRSKGEHRAAREFPMFLGLKLVRASD